MSIYLNFIKQDPIFGSEDELFQDIDELFYAVETKQISAKDAASLVIERIIIRDFEAIND